MELDQFVEKTLVQIVKGVEAAQKKVIPMRGAINPSVDITSADDRPREAGTRRTLENVEFDVAVIASKSETVEGGTNTKFIVWSLGVSGETTSTGEQSSRVKFKVPLVLPLAEEE